MARKELKTATNDELIYALNYYGYDSYYRNYRDDVVAEIKKRMQEPILDKIKAEMEKIPTAFATAYTAKSEALKIIDKYKESEDKE